MSEGAEAQRLLQAVQHFQNRSRGAELPKGTEEALKALQDALGQPSPGRDTPGAREALSLSPGTGTGSPMKDAAKGTDAPSPGQREAQQFQAQIQQAAAAIAGKAS